jgi:hypothetical protein
MQTTVKTEKRAGVPGAMFLCHYKILLFLCTKDRNNKPYDCKSTACTRIHPQNLEAASAAAMKAMLGQHRDALKIGDVAMGALQQVADLRAAAEE